MVTWLRPDARPRLVATSRGLADARALTASTDWGRAFLAEQTAVAAPFVSLPQERLRALVPAPGSLYVHGVGLNLDPVDDLPLRWRGWTDPAAVEGKDGTRYPNREWPDAGRGVVDRRTGERRHFVAVANGARVRSLETEVLPALADVYALTGSAAHARAAAVLLDALASAYAESERGPLDARDASGRLDRPGYQVGRALWSYASVADLLAPSTELDRPSGRGRGTIRENVAVNLLWNGGQFCLAGLRASRSLDNGVADYLRGAAVAGAVLGEETLYRPLLAGTRSLVAFLENAVDGEGMHVESAALYRVHSIEVYLQLAELETALSAGTGTIHHPRMRALLDLPFDRLALAGVVPATGDTHHNARASPPERLRPEAAAAVQERYRGIQAAAAFTRMLHADGTERARWATVLRGLVDPGRPFAPAAGHRRWMLYRLSPQLIAEIEGAPAPAPLRTSASSIQGAAGLALLRGGRSGQEYGAHLLFGPAHNHAQLEALTWNFYAEGVEWGLDPGHARRHFRRGWTQQSVAHQSMVVDQGSVHPADGAGHLVAWNGDPEAQWAMASHPGAYRNRGVTRFERLVAQVAHPDGSGRWYWLDAGFVAGGRTRDDVFHTAMAELRLRTPAPLRPDSPFGIAPAPRILGDGRLAGTAGRGESWAPSGAGYPFLRRPRSAAATSVVQTVWSRPALAAEAGGVLLADFAPAPGRRLIVAEGPEGPTRLAVLPSVPYLLLRDTGTAVSVFAKIVRRAASENDDPVTGFEPLTLAPCDDGEAIAEGAGAWVVHWRSGDRDVWIAQGSRRGRACAPAGALPALETNGSVTLFRFGPQGRPLRILASEASRVSVGGGPSLCGVAVMEGEVVRPEDPERSTRVAVRWRGATPPGAAAAGRHALTLPPSGQPSTWTVAAVGPDWIEFGGTDLLIGRSRLLPARWGRGWRPETPLPRLTYGPRHAHRAYAVGRSVYANGRFVDRVAAFHGDPPLLHLAGRRGSGPFRAPIDAVFSAVGPGDQVRIPLALSWRSGEEEAGSSCGVAPPR